MNWKRGAFRLWIAASVCWIVLVGVYAWPRVSRDVVVQYTPSAKDKAKYQACIAAERKRGGHDYMCAIDVTIPNSGINTRPARFSEMAASAIPYLLAIIAGPLGALAVWFSSAWIVAGFRRSPAN